MTKQIRSSVFETNSSSSHSLTLGTGNLVATPFSPEMLRAGEVPLRPGEYGWEWRRYYTAREKLGYLLTQVTDGKVEVDTEALRESNPFFAQLYDVVKDHTGCRLVVEPGQGSIDHQSARAEGAVGMKLFDDTDKLRAFLFDDTAYLETGNDNNPPPWTISSDIGQREYFSKYMTSVHSAIPKNFRSRKLTRVSTGQLRGFKTGAGGWLPDADEAHPLWLQVLQQGIVTSATIVEYASSDYSSGSCARGAAAIAVLQLSGASESKLKLIPGFQGGYQHVRSDDFSQELEFVVHIPAELAGQLDELDSKGYRKALKAKHLYDYAECKAASKRDSSDWRVKQEARALEALKKLGVSQKAINEYLKAQAPKKAKTKTADAGQGPRCLTLAVKKEFFDQIAAGSKGEEFRLANAFWTKRLEGKSFEKLVITLGYPKADDTARRLTFAWNGFERRMHQHSLFGPEPVEVFAISLAKPMAAAPGIQD